MNKQEICDSLRENYSTFVLYINSLTTNEYIFCHQQKWTAGQQLTHIVLCVKPILRVFSMEKTAIEESFGLANGESCSFEVLQKGYLAKLKLPYTTSDRYLPEIPLPNQREILTQNLTKIIQDLCDKIADFSEQDLDTFCIPHPLLGNLTMREMLYNVIHHVQHHHTVTQENLHKNEKNNH